MRLNLIDSMDTIFKNETGIDEELKEFFKGSIQEDICRDKYADDSLYTLVLMRSFKKVLMSYKLMQTYIFITWIFVGWIVPFYFLKFIQDRTLAIAISSVLWMVVFSFISKNSLSEPSLLLKAKMQAYKELLREVSIHWYRPQ